MENGTGAPFEIPIRTQRAASGTVDGCSYVGTAKLTQKLDERVPALSLRHVTTEEQDVGTIGKVIIPLR